MPLFSIDYETDLKIFTKACASESQFVNHYASAFESNLRLNAKAFGSLRHNKRSNAGFGGK